MRKRAALVLALLVALIVPTVPASAGSDVALSGSVLDENGRPVAGATVRFSVEVPESIVSKIGGMLDGLFDALACAFSFGLMCDDDEEVLPAYRVVATGRTDRNGRYVLRFASSRPADLHRVHDVQVTGPTLVRGTLPAVTSMSTASPRGRTIPAFRLWLKGPALDPVSPARRRLRAGVPRVLGTAVRPPTVVLVQGTRTAWSYGQVVRDRDVDARVAEQGTTGTQATVTAKAGQAYVTYRSGVRPVTRTVRPLSRGKACYGYRGVLSRDPMPDCTLTDGRLADPPEVPTAATRFVVDLGALSTPEAYLARGCRVYAVAASVDGEVFLDVEVAEDEHRVYTGKPDVPVRYVRVDVGSCDPMEVSVFGAPLRLPVPPVPAAPTVADGDDIDGGDDVVRGPSLPPVRPGEELLVSEGRLELPCPCGH